MEKLSLMILDNLKYCFFIEVIFGGFLKAFISFKINGTL